MGSLPNIKWGVYQKAVSWGECANPNAPCVQTPPLVAICFGKLFPLFSSLVGNPDFVGFMTLFNARRKTGHIGLMNVKSRAAWL